jgi:hypothetical protein
VDCQCETVHRDYIRCSILSNEPNPKNDGGSIRPRYGQYGIALASVAAICADNAWAVDCTDGCPIGGTPMIERWRGASWRQVAPPASPHALDNLAGVATTSITSACAIGSGPSLRKPHWWGVPVLPMAL